MSESFEDKRKLYEWIIKLEERIQRLETREFGSISLLDFIPPTTYVISGGVISVTTSYIGVQAETGVADDLDTINGTDIGNIIIVVRVGAVNVTLKDNTGNLRLAGDFLMDTFFDTIMLINRGGNLHELSRSNNA